jgi:tetratricopeptide (TPR) repeat protein
MARLAERSREKSGTAEWITDMEASALAYSGRLRLARTKTQQAASFALSTDHRRRLGCYYAEAAVRESFFGNSTEAHRSADAALYASKDRDVVFGAALALALAGDFSGAQAPAADLENRFGNASVVRTRYLAVLRALEALQHREPAKAIEALQAALPGETAWFDNATVGFVGGLYPTYVRGEAYLAAGKGAEAAGEFARILAQRGIVVSDPIGALSRWKLGQAYAMAGQTAKAKAAYEDFLALWKNADRDIPILKQIQLEYSKLSNGK